MKLLLIFLFILTGCTIEEGNITINYNGNSPQSNPSNDETLEDDTPSNHSTTLLYDFSDSSLFTQNFNFISNGGVDLNLNDSMPGTNSEAASCSSFSDSYKGYYQESIDTFNLPITIEFDFVTKNAW